MTKRQRLGDETSGMITLYRVVVVVTVVMWVWLWFFK
jgi:hypothetical protein